MNLTKRTLMKWRKEALSYKSVFPEKDGQGDYNEIKRELGRIELNKRILRMTQILLDQELMKGK